MAKIIGSILNGHILKVVICTGCGVEFSSRVWVHKNSQGHIVEFIPNHKKCQPCRETTSQIDRHIDIQTAIMANCGKLNDLDLRKTKKHAKICDPCNAILIEAATRIQNGEIKIDPEA